MAKSDSDSNGLRQDQPEWLFLAVAGFPLVGEGITTRSYTSVDYCMGPWASRDMPHSDPAECTPNPDPRLISLRRSEILSQHLDDRIDDPVDPCTVPGATIALVQKTGEHINESSHTRPV